MTDLEQPGQSIAFAAPPPPELGPSQADRLEHMRNAPVTVKLEASDDGPRILATLTEGCYFRAHVVRRDDGVLVAEAGQLFVDPELRGHGIGERLVRAVAYKAKELGATLLSSFIVHEAALEIRRKVFGKENLSVVDAADPAGPANFDEAMAFLAEAGKNEADPENRQEGVAINVDLSNIDMSDWERPTY